MEALVKHYKFINSKTGNIIFYHTVNASLRPEEIKEKLEAVKAQVAVNNSLFMDTVYYEEFKEGE